MGRDAGARVPPKKNRTSFTEQQLTFTLRLHWLVLGCSDSGMPININLLKAAYMKNKLSFESMFVVQSDSALTLKYPGKKKSTAYR